MKCLKCKKEKEEREFPKDHTRKSGLHPYCLVCKRNDSRERNRNKRQQFLEQGRLCCLRCGREKPAIQFYVANSRRRSLLCEDCKTDSIERERRLGIERGLRQYWKNPEHYRTRRRVIDRARREETKTEMIIALGSKCQDCGLEFSEEWPVACFDFHHLHDKQVTIGRILKNKHRNRLLEELKKCQLLCANCHRRKHYWLTKEQQGNFSNPDRRQRCTKSKSVAVRLQ